MLRKLANKGPPKAICLKKKTNPEEVTFAALECFQPGAGLTVHRCNCLQVTAEWKASQGATPAPRAALLLKKPSSSVALQQLILSPTQPSC